MRITIRILSLFVVFLTVSREVLSADTCGRIAIINYQKVLVDVSSTQRGEGLRYYLEKDRTAKHYLDLYQKGTRIHRVNTFLGTLGPGLLVGGLLVDSNSELKKNFFSWGGALVIINFLVTGMIRDANEENLIKAIEEYNKRNSPQIYFKTNVDEFDPDPLSRSNNDFSVFLQKTWEF